MDLAGLSQMAKSAYSFTDSESASFAHSLQPVDGTIRSLATRYGLRLHWTASKGWPGRMLTKRKGLKKYVLSITLGESYDRTRDIQWDISELWMYDYGEIYRKLIASRDIAIGVDPEMIADGRAGRLLANTLRDAFPDR